MSRSPEEIRTSILEQVIEYYEAVHAERPFIPGETRVNYAGRIFDENELKNLVSSSLDFWLTAGPYAQQFETKLKNILGVRELHTTNSGSSANLVAMTTLKSNQLDNPIQAGDEVIVPATSFPTTVNPILQNGFVPVYIDSNLHDFNFDIDALEQAVSDKTRALIFAHTLGNAAEMDAIVEFVKKHNLFLIEDTCDALGTLWDGKPVGKFGDFGTLSFYPAHHITLGEGGAVFTNSPKLAKIARSVRDWGRDCYCGYDNPVNGKCGVRFETEIPGIPGYYDHRYYYTEIGYNLKLTDMQAAIGLAQLDKLSDFIAKRKTNFAYLYEGLQPFSEFIQPVSWHEKADVSWFAFPMLVKENAPFQRHELTRFLELNHVETRLIFAGNITRHPAYQNAPSRIVGDLANSDAIMERGFFVGVYPGLDQPRLDYMLDTFRKFFTNL